MDDGKSSDKLTQAKSKFLSDMSREIQNTMKTIMSKCDLVRQSDLNANQSEHIDAIFSSARKLSWIVNDILDFSQLELGKIELQAIDFNLEYLINDIFKKTVRQKKDHPVDTYIDINKDVPRNLIGDPTRLRQVLVNLLSNAFKFTLKGEVGIVVRLSENQPDTRNDNKVNIQFNVKDTGKGIPGDRLKTIFDLRSQSKPAESWEFGGTGLGLAICKLIVEAMRGTIEVTSQEGAGSNFTVNLEFQKGTSPSERKVYPLERSELIGKKAIIVDDNEIARKILKKCCDTLGIETVLISASPKAVLQMLDEMAQQEDVPDLILCDIMMPEMDGYEMVKRVRANDRFKTVKCIAVTSAVHVGSARNAQESGFSGFLPKPVFLDELAKIITTVLGDDREEKTIITRHMAEELKFNNTKVLILEEEGNERKLLEECLEMLHCAREYVSSGQEAVDSIVNKIHDLCLMDYNIFMKEGAETVRIIKEVSRNIPVVLLLAVGMEKHRSECLEAGADDFIIKPVDMISIKRIITRYGKK